MVRLGRIGPLASKTLVHAQTRPSQEGRRSASLHGMLKAAGCAASVLELPLAVDVCTPIVGRQASTQIENPSSSSRRLLF
jgi:hypothetical protein